MKDVVFRRMYDVKPDDLFSFAVGDYLYKYNYDIEEVKNHYIYGAILESGDINDEFFKLMDIIMSGGNGVAMVIFDINKISAADINQLLKLDNTHGFEEMRDCYEDRVVFARD